MTDEQQQELDETTEQNEEQSAYELGVDAYEAGNYEQAIEHLTTFIEEEPTAWFAYTMRGNAHDSNGDQDKAMADYTEAIAHNPRDDNALNGKGLLYSYAGEYKLALDFFKRASKIDRSSFAYKYNIAVATARHWSVLRASKQIESVRPMLESFKTDEDEQKQAYAHYGLGGLLALDPNTHDAALDSLEAAIKLDPSVKDWAKREIAWLDLHDNDRFNALLADTQS